MPAAYARQSDRTAAGDLLANLARKVFSFPAVLGTLLVAGAFISIAAGVGKVSSDPSAASQFWIGAVPDAIVSCSPGRSHLT